MQKGENNGEGKVKDIDIERKRGKETKGKTERKGKTRVRRRLAERMRKGEGKRKINVYRYISKLFI